MSLTGVALRYYRSGRTVASIMFVRVEQSGMSRTLVGVLGALTALFPARIVAVFERLAVADSGEATPRAWVTTAMRSEGVLVAVVALLGGGRTRG